MSDELNQRSQTDQVVGFAQQGATTDGVVASGNATISSGDVGAEVLKEKQRLEEDLRKLKSTYDKQISKMEQAHKRELQQVMNELNETRAELERLRELLLNDEEARKKYDSFKEQSEVERLRKELEQYKQMEQEREVKTRWVTFFHNLGIQVDAEGDLDTIAQQGWEGVQRELERLRALEKQLSENTKSSSGSVSPVQTQAKPSVRTDMPASPGTSLSWSELVKRYGSEERVFRAVELGFLPPDILPT